jgi:hypothetical protein
MMQVNCARLPFSEINYPYNKFHQITAQGHKGKGKEPANSNGPAAIRGSGWNIADDRRFHISKINKLEYYIIQDLDQTMGDGDVQRIIDTFEEELKNQMDRRCHLDKTKITRTNPYGLANSLRHSDRSLNRLQVLNLRVAEAVERGANLVVLMLPNFDRSMYAAFKT